MPFTFIIFNYLLTVYAQASAAVKSIQKETVQSKLPKQPAPSRKRKLVDTPMDERPACKFYKDGKCAKVGISLGIKSLKVLKYDSCHDVQALLIHCNKQYTFRATPPVMTTPNACGLQLISYAFEIYTL
jgi:hypothetical protein